MIIGKTMKRIVSILTVLLVIANSGYLLQVTGGAFSSFIQIATIVVGLILIAKYLVKHHLRIPFSTLSQRAIVVFFVLCSLSMVMNFEISPLYLNLFSVAFIPFYIVEKNDSRKLVSCFVNVMFVIALISLAFTAWISLFGAPTPFSIVTTTASTYNYGVYFYTKMWSGVLVRNKGLFWEPGLFSSYLVVALMLEIELNPKPKIWKIIILVITVISTYSTAGILLLPFIAILFVNKNVNNRSIRAVLFSMLVVVAIIGTLFSTSIVEYLVGVNPDVFSKLLGTDLTKTTRLGAPRLNFDIFMKYPIFGAGFSGATELFQQGKVEYFADSQTSTSLFMMAALGIGGILYSIWWIRGIAECKAFTLLSKIVVMVIVILILNKEPHNALMGTWLSMFLFMKPVSKDDVFEIKRESYLRY